MLDYTELSMGWVDSRVGLGWVGLGHGSEMTDVRKLHVVYM